MKKLIISFLFFFLCFSVFAEGMPEQKKEPEITEQPNQPQRRLTFISDLLAVDGTDWMSWIPPQKFSFLAGMLTTQSAMILALNSYNIIKLTEEEVRKLTEWLIFSDPVEVIGSKIDYYYMSTGDLKAGVWAVLYAIYGKQWWDIKKIEKNNGLNFQEMKDLTGNEKEVIMR